LIQTGTPTPDERIAVLLVEDDADQAELVTRTLRRQDASWIVTTVRDGAACLDAMTAGSYSIILLDYSLPRMSGLEVLAEIRKLGALTPVVMVTGQGDERVVVEAMRAGAADYIIKSGGYLTTLATVVRKALKQHELALENARLYTEAQRSLADLQEAQERLVQGATLRAVGAMASGAAHHLNNLLAVVLGRTLLLLDAPGAEPCRQPLQVIARAAEDAAEVVRRVQRFSRMDASEERRQVDLNTIILEVVEMTRGRWQDEAQVRGIQIEVCLLPGPVPPVLANGAGLREGLMNIVLNAAEALSAGGRIEIRTFREGEHACVTVADTGTGMCEEVRRRALEPFFTTKGPKGTGLGLSVSYAIVESHGGELGLESLPGQGTVVTIRLPIMSEGPSEGASTGRVEDPPVVAHQRILVVDDEDAVLSLMADLVASLGHEALQAGCGSEALSLLDGGAKVDLVLTDLGMPGMTGWDVARAIRSRWPLLPVGLVTGWGSLDVSAADRDLIVGTVPKPIAPEALSALIAGARRWQEAESRSARSPAGAGSTEKLSVGSDSTR
jgi:signal transduction histidine kinase